VQGFLRKIAAHLFIVHTCFLYFSTGGTHGDDATRQTWKTFDTKTTRPGGGGGVAIAITDEQRQKVQQLEQRDCDFDRQLEVIGQGLEDLSEIAALQGEHVQRQSVLLDQIDHKMDSATQRMSNVNGRLNRIMRKL